MSAPASSGPATGAAATDSPPLRPDVEQCAGHADRHGPLIPTGGAEPLTVTATAAGCADQSESDAPAAAPAVARLHRHALESVFAFLSKGELAFALRVSRDWLSAVGSMRRLGLEIRWAATSARVIVASAMGRHVIALGGDLSDRMWFDTETLSILADRMAHLHRLSCWFDPPLPDQPLAFPSSLRRLDVQMFETADAADINAAIAAIGRLPLLDELTIQVDKLDPQFSFAPLAALPLLRRLDVDWPKGGPPNDAQVDQLRALPRLQEFNVSMTTPLLRLLLRQPHQLQWQQISLPRRLDDETAALLPQLPSLTTLSQNMRCERFDWLRGLPNLTDICLSHDGQDLPVGRAAPLVAGLQTCTKIEILLLADLPDLTAAHLAELLPRLPRLRELLLDRLSIDSLSFLAQPPLTDQLSSLRLWGRRRLPLSELRHVHSLRGLKTLKLFSAFAEPVDDDAQSLAVMPLLEEFGCCDD